MYLFCSRWTRMILAEVGRKDFRHAAKPLRVLLISAGNICLDAPLSRQYDDFQSAA